MEFAIMLRRQFLRQSTGLVIGMGIVGAGGRASGAGSGDLRFDVLRNGSEIGYHVLSFNQDGDRLTVDIDIELRVRVAFITAYRYEHRNREQWEAGELLGFRSRTNDNGTRHSVEVERDGDQLIIRGSEGRIESPGSALPTTYWHRNFMERDWYHDDRWVKLGFTASDGSRIDYRLTNAEAYEFLSFSPGEPSQS